MHKRRTPGGRCGTQVLYDQTSDGWFPQLPGFFSLTVEFCHTTGPQGARTAEENPDIETSLESWKIHGGYPLFSWIRPLSEKFLFFFGEFLFLRNLACKISKEIYASSNLV